MISFPRTILLLMLCVLAALAPTTAGGADRAAEKRLQDLRRELRETKRDITKADRKERSVLADLEKIDRTIKAGIAELKDQQARLLSAETALRDLERDTLLLRRDLDEVKEVYRMRIRALYMMDGRRHPAAAFAFDGLQGALRRMRYLAAVAEKDREIIARYSDALDRLELRHKEIAGLKDGIERRKQAVDLKKEELEANRRSKREMLASVRKQKVLYEQAAGELEKASASLWAKIRRAEEERKARRRAAAAQQQPEAAASIAAKGRLPWPVAGEIATRFGVQNHPQFGTRVFRRGSEISARTGDEVRAVNDGRVAYADWYRGFGKLMIIEHGQGLHTLYGHLGRIDANKGDSIRAGQVIGAVGGTGVQEGSRLYFELRYRGEAQDPLRWLLRR